MVRKSTAMRSDFVASASSAVIHTPASSQAVSQVAAARMHPRTAQLPGLRRLAFRLSALPVVIAGRFVVCSRGVTAARCAPGLFLHIIEAILHGFELRSELINFLFRIPADLLLACWV